MKAKVKYKGEKLLQETVDAYLESQDKSVRTVRTIASALNRLVRLLGDDLDLSDLDADALIEYRAMLREDNLSWGSSRTYVSMVRNFFKWLILRRWASFSTDDVERAMEIVKSSNGRKPVPLPKLPDEDDVKLILKEAENQTLNSGTDRQMWATMRNAALLHVLRVTGVRVQELVGIKFSDLHMDEDYIIIREGKGEKERIVFLDDDAKNWLSGWTYEHPDQGDDCPVFIRLDRRAPDYAMAMTTESVRFILRKLCAEVGIKRITPHQFRHRFGTAVYVAAGLGAAADLLGHADLGTARTYAKLARGQMQGKHRLAKL